MDEKSMIIEQERQAKAKKRRKYKKYKWMAGVLAVVLAGGSIWYAVQGRYLVAASRTASVEIVAGNNQEIVYAYIEKINGNEITYRITEEPVTVQMSTENTEGSVDMSQIPEGMNFGNGQMPDVGNGQIPEGTNFGDGQMPDFGNGQMSGGMNFGGGQMGGRGSRGNGSNTEGAPSDGVQPDIGSRGQNGSSSDTDDANAGNSEKTTDQAGKMPANGSMPGGMASGGGRPDSGSGQGGGNFDRSNGETPDLGNGETPDFGNGEAPDFGNDETPDFGNGEAPDFGNGETPDFGNGEVPDFTNGEAPDFGKGGMPDFADGDISEGMNSGTISEETYTKYIPVGTDVTTKLGTVTTFSRLAAGDTVALIMEKDGEEQIIVAVYIVG